MPPMESKNIEHLFVSHNVGILFTSFIWGLWLYRQREREREIYKICIRKYIKIYPWMAMIRCRIVLLSNTIKLNSFKIVNVVCSIYNTFRLFLYSRDIMEVADIYSEIPISKFLIGHLHSFWWFILFHLKKRV